MDDSVSWSHAPDDAFLQRRPSFPAITACSALAACCLTSVASGSVLSPLGQNTARLIQCITGVSSSLFPPAPSELWLFCPSLGRCQVPCRDLALMQWSLSDKINGGNLIHTEAGQQSRAAWRALIRSTMIVLPGGVVWWLAQQIRCKWLVATACWRAAPF